MAAAEEALGIGSGVEAKHCTNWTAASLKLRCVHVVGASWPLFRRAAQPQDLSHAQASQGRKQLGKARQRRQPAGRGIRSSWLLLVRLLLSSRGESREGQPSEGVAEVKRGLAERAASMFSSPCGVLQP